MKTLMAALAVLGATTMMAAPAFAHRDDHRGRHERGDQSGWYRRGGDRGQRLSPGNEGDQHGRVVSGVRGGGGSALMRIARSLAVVVFALTVASAGAARPQNTGLGRALATKLMAKKAFQAKTHTTDWDRS